MMGCARGHLKAYVLAESPGSGRVMARHAVRERTPGRGSNLVLESPLYDAKAHFSGL